MSQARAGRRLHSGVGALALLLGAVVAPVPAAADTGSNDDTTASSGASDAHEAATPRRGRGARGAENTVSDAKPAPRSAPRHDRTPIPAAAAAVSDERSYEAKGPVESPAESAVESPAESAPETGTGSMTSVPVQGSTVDEAPQLADPHITARIGSDAEAPSMTVAPARGAVAAVSDPLAWLGEGTDPLGPVATPFGWAVLAVTRRELSTVSITKAGAAAVSTGEPVASPLLDALARPGAITALVTAARSVATDIAAGGAVADALQGGIAALATDPVFGDISVESLLNDPGLPQAAGSATTAVITGLAADPQVQAAVGQGLHTVLSSALQGTPGGSVIATTVRDAAVALLADAGARAALGSAAGTAVSVFLAQPGVVPALAEVAPELQDALNGNDFGAALDSAWESLRSDASVRDGVGVAVTEAVNGALSDPGLVSALGRTATSLVNDLAADPSTRTLVGELLGSTYGDTIVGLLSDPATAGGVAAAAGSVVTGFLAEPVVTEALSGAAAKVVIALLDGTAPRDAVTGVLRSLQSDPAIASAMDSVVAVALHSVLDKPVVQDAVGTVAEKVVVNLVTGSADPVGLNPVVGQLVGVAVESLLGNSAVQDLISELAPAVLNGTPAGDLTGTVIQAVVSRPALQAAAGTAVGAAVGSLLGDNPIATLVGNAVANAVTALIRVAVSNPGLLSLFGITLPAAAENRSGSSYLFATG